MFLTQGQKVYEKDRMNTMLHYNNHGIQDGSKNKKALKWTFLLIATYMIVEVIGGIMTNSLALLSDAGHMLRLLA